MYDPRWDDARERDDGRARVYDQRDRDDGRARLYDQPDGRLESDRVRRSALV